LGTGESGMGAAQLAFVQQLDLFVSDYGAISSENKSWLEEHAIPYEERMHSIDRILESDLIIKSPGIPDTAPVVQHAIANGVSVISEIEFAFKYLPSSAKVIAITGTNGKTTTTLLTHHLLKSAGLNVALAGNVGISLAKQVSKGGYDYYVVEVSSFQLDGIVDFRPDVAVLLNITPDHLDRYNDDFNQYVASKFRITENLTKDQCFIYCADSLPVSKEVIRRNIDACVFAISASNQNKRGAYLKNGRLIFNVDQQDADIPVSDIKLIGKHNMINAMAGVLSAISVEVPIRKIIQGLRTFKNAPHRLEVVAQLNQVKYVNDSKATNVDAVFYALDGINLPIVWIAGGVDKGNDYAQIEELVKAKVKGIICLGTDNNKIRQFFEGKVPQIIETTDVKEAVEIANHWTSSEEVVLLSPACASFDLFKNYEDRGEQFKVAVNALKNKKRQEL
jgi:UDP-N-acetylmuramoylalanine--D-glutamate ligase